MLKISKLANNYLPVRDFLYILQLEEYHLVRYLRQVGPRLLRRNFEKRDKLKFTTRTKLIYFLTNLLIISFILSNFYLAPNYIILAVLFLPIIIPYLIALAALPVDLITSVAKQNTLNKARRFFTKKYPEVKIIAITGSYGKTTMKYRLLDLLQYTHKTEIIPENINTSLGVANYILANNISSDTEYLIVEMGAYVRGDIKEFTDMLPPDLSVITKLGDQHLERFGSFANLVAAKHEIFAGTKKDGARYASTETIEILKEHHIDTSTIRSVVVTEKESGTKIISAAIARDLGVEEKFIKDSNENFTPPARRNQNYTHDGVTIIDNSYNISPQTAKKNILEAKRMANNLKKTLVVMTAGIGEQGQKNSEVNRNLGSLLNETADRVILNPSVFHKDIKQVLSMKTEIVEFAKDVLTTPSDYLDCEKEILLVLPEQSDLAYL